MVVIEDQVLQSQKMEALGRLASGVAHDFNNTLTCILGLARLMLHDSEKNELKREDLEKIANAGEHASVLVRQLLVFSPRPILQPEVLNLNSLIKSAEPMLRSLIEDRVQLVINLAPDLDNIKADADQIKQVIMTMILNVRDAIPQCEKIFLETANVEIREEEVQGAQVKPGPHVSLNIESELGRRTQFKICFPRVGAPPFLTE